MNEVLTDDELNAEFERFWEIVDPNHEFSMSVKEIARQCYYVGIRSNERAEAFKKGTLFKKGEDE